MESSVDGTQTKCCGWKVAWMGHEQNALNVFVGNDEYQSAVARTWRRCEDNIKTNLKEIELDSSGSICGPVAGSCEHGIVHSRRGDHLNKSTVIIFQIK